ncbi:MAG: response regulator [Spirochaetaceae bacterium]|jgi:putative two-component system response regulator|nr:response regulator [Spirochaetaceae bacterium]
MDQILVVDDNLANLKNIQLQLSDSYHYQVVLAKSGAQALQICIQRIPDLILLDVDMPEMDGFETLSRIKDNSLLNRIPVIFLTANHDMATEIRALESGVVDFITKPVEKSILHHRLQLHLNLARYQQHLEETVKELEDSIVLSFSEMIESRDKNTGDHVQRTRIYVTLLGRELIAQGRFAGGLNERELSLITRAALLHDIGKIGISDTILLKPGRLDDVEFGVMKTHTTIGAEILETMYKRTPTQHYLKYAKQIAEGHHEKYDGSGYPYGIKGEAIPLCSRIMAVADVYDAVVADRIYRKAMTPQEAYNLIVEGKGTHFDPAVIDAFIAVRGELEAVARRSSARAGAAAPS